MSFFIVFFFIVMVLLMFGLQAKQAGDRRERVAAARQFDPQKVHGSARFATNADCRKAGLFKRRGIRIGYSPQGRKKLFFNGAGHLLTIAGARTGKALTLLVEAILSLPRRYSLLLFDPKCELTAICGHYLARRGRFYVLNPYGILPDALKGLKQAHLNPMAGLDPNSPSFHAECDKLADAICWDEHYGSESHWIMSARLLISGVIAALAKYGAPEEKNLVAVRNVITGAAGASVLEFCRACMGLPDVFIRQKLARFAGTGAEESRELSSIVSTADSQTGFLGDEALAESLKQSDVSFRDLKRKRGTAIAVCLPLDKLAVAKKYFRILCATALSDLLEEGLCGPGAPVIAVLDEVVQIGPLKILADAWAMAAGAAGLQMWAIYQDVSQIAAQFKNWQTMIANSGAAMYFGVRVPQTAEFVSKQCGVTEVLTQSRSVTIDLHSGEPVVNDGTGQTSRPLLHPDEVQFGLRKDEMLLFTDGMPGVIRAHRKPYFRCWGLGGKYRKNPYYRKPAPRFLRWLFD